MRAGQTQSVLREREILVHLFELMGEAPKVFDCLICRRDGLDDCDCGRNDAEGIHFDL